MANEWVKIELYGPNGDGGAKRMTIADGFAVSVGTALSLSDPRTVVAQTASAPFAGVSAEEHIANKGITSITVETDGRYDVSASGSITVGAPLVLDKSLNHIKELAMSSFATFAASMASIMAYSDEIGSDGEVISIRIQR